MSFLLLTSSHASFSGESLDHIGWTTMAPMASSPLLRRHLESSAKGRCRVVVVLRPIRRILAVVAALLREFLLLCLCSLYVIHFVRVA